MKDKSLVSPTSIVFLDVEEKARAKDIGGKRVVEGTSSVHVV